MLTSGSVILPVKALLEQYKSNDSNVIKQLDLPFIQHSLGRLDEDDRRALVPIALRGCSKDEGLSRAPTFFNFILQLLVDVRLPSRGSKDDEALRASIGLEDEADAKYLAKMLSIFLRLRPPTPSKTLAESNPTFSQEEINFFSVEGAGTVKIFQNISQLRVKIVAFLASAAFTDEEKFIPAMYASCSPDTRVASLAEEVIKRTSVSFENEDLVKNCSRLTLEVLASGHPSKLTAKAFVAGGIFYEDLTDQLPQSSERKHVCRCYSR